MLHDHFQHQFLFWLVTCFRVCRSTRDNYQFCLANFTLNAWVNPWSGFSNTWIHNSLWLRIWAYRLCSTVDHIRWCALSQKLQLKSAQHSCNINHILANGCSNKLSWVGICNRVCLVPLAYKYPQKQAATHYVCL